MAPDQYHSKRTHVNNEATVRIWCALSQTFLDSSPSGLPIHNIQQMSSTTPQPVSNSAFCKEVAEYMSASFRGKLCEKTGAKKYPVPGPPSGLSTQFVQEANEIVELLISAFTYTRKLLCLSSHNIIANIYPRSQTGVQCRVLRRRIIHQYDRWKRG